MAGDEVEARAAADRLALALEDAGFDVGEAFPSLQDTIGRRGLPVVRLGDVSPATAERLAAVLAEGAASDVVRWKEGGSS
jgi:hypothetical protein